jgi:hypothetical protein
MGKKPLFALTVLGLGLALTGCQNSGPKTNSTAYNPQPTFPRGTATAKQDGAAGKQDGGMSGVPSTTTSGLTPGAGVQNIPSGRTNLTDTLPTGGTTNLVPPPGRGVPDGSGSTLLTSPDRPKPMAPVMPVPPATIQQTNRPMSEDTIHEVPSSLSRPEVGASHPVAPVADDMPSLSPATKTLPAIDVQSPPPSLPSAPVPVLPASGSSGLEAQPGAGPSLSLPPASASPPALPALPTK